MKPSKVFFTDFHATPIETLPQKLHRLMKHQPREVRRLRPLPRDLSEGCH